ncbi:hypothetical protein BKA93DRAFT_822173 [Sparassis latifolia]
MFARQREAQELPATQRSQHIASSPAGPSQQGESSGTCVPPEVITVSDDSEEGSVERDDPKGKKKATSKSYHVKAKFQLTSTGKQRHDRSQGSSLRGEGSGTHVATSELEANDNSDIEEGNIEKFSCQGQFLTKLLRLDPRNFPIYRGASIAHRHSESSHKRKCFGKRVFTSEADDPSNVETVEPVEDLRSKKKPTPKTSRAKSGPSKSISTMKRKPSEPLQEGSSQQGRHSSGHIVISEDHDDSAVALVENIGNPKSKQKETSKKVAVLSKRTSSTRKGNHGSSPQPEAELADATSSAYSLTSGREPVDDDSDEEVAPTDDPKGKKKVTTRASRSTAMRGQSTIGSMFDLAQ